MAAIEMIRSQGVIAKVVVVAAWTSNLRYGELTVLGH